MELGPQLAALVAATIAPTKFAVDCIAISSRRKLPAGAKFALAYAVALLLMVLYTVYVGGVESSLPPERGAAGLMLGAFFVMQGAILLTEAQKRASRDKES